MTNATGRSSFQARIARAIAWAQERTVVRVFLRYADKRGPLLAAGLSYQAIFAVFAALWVTFAIAGVVIARDPALQQAILDVIGMSVPGLIDDGSGTGAIEASALFEAGILGWTGALAAIGLVFTALAWLDGVRGAVRTIVGLRAPAVHFLLLKLIDLGLAIGFGLAIVASAALSVFSTSALDSTLGWLGIDEDSVVAAVLARTIGLLLVLVLDTVVLAVFYRVLAGIPVPWRPLVLGSLAGAVALGVLKTLGSTLLGGATTNPLLAGFAVIIGLLIWFNLVCQVILLGASWIAVRIDDLESGHSRSVGSRA